MGAYGDITCRYCGESYYELDEHTCNTEHMKERIQAMGDRINRLKELRDDNASLEMDLEDANKRIQELETRQVTMHCPNCERAGQRVKELEDDNKRLNNWVTTLTGG